MNLRRGNLTRRDALLVTAALLLPIPVLAQSGLSVPLPGSIKRGLGSLVTLNGDDPRTGSQSTGRISGGSQAERQSEQFGTGRSATTLLETGTPTAAGEGSEAGFHTTAGESGSGSGNTPAESNPEGAGDGGGAGSSGDSGETGDTGESGSSQPTAGGSGGVSAVQPPPAGAGFTQEGGSGTGDGTTLLDTGGVPTVPDIGGAPTVPDTGGAPTVPDTGGAPTVPDTGGVIP